MSESDLSLARKGFTGFCFQNSISGEHGSKTTGDRYRFIKSSFLYILKEIPYLHVRSNKKFKNFRVLIAFFAEKKSC